MALLLLQAVIGAGAAGLVAVRELLREGHAVTAFEAGATCGGTWRYTPEVEEGDLLGQGSTRRRVHSSMYR
jgi:cation diffusion facilitator CzcD-associated flavoprotein CzcO